MNNNQHRYVQIFLSEYNSFLVLQKEYDFDIRIMKDKIMFNLMKIGCVYDIPDKIDCIISLINDKLTAEINGIFFDYNEKILETYIKNYIKTQIMKKNDKNELHIAADMLGLGLDDIMNRDLIIKRYKLAVKKLHPDKWIHENNPIITKNATEAVVRFTEARDILLNNIKGESL
jgi:hypothetical protein